MAAPVGLASRLLIETLLPAACPVCEEPLADHRGGVCARCWAEVVAIPSTLLPAQPRRAGPGRFLASLSTLGSYEGRLKAIIRCLKFGDLPEVGARLGALMAPHLKNLPGGFDLVVPVPLHYRRRWRRGYNQAETIAAALATASGRPMSRRALRRRRPTAPQSGRSRRQRVTNVSSAFAPGRRLLSPLETRSLSGVTVLLVDDVVTTGATMRECARVLKACGAREVHAAAAARTLLHAHTLR
ncbi:MAG TPA: phosphoribosyltransferase family protein [Candidatus Polarisedimenticolia bacterium]|nr:phosphoribosyltransferase family protein [Candidatus Polarisedimenticolia bacterium]